MSPTEPLPDQSDTRCDRPPAGWWCSREKDHDGPCAARPTGRAESEREARLARRLKNILGIVGVEKDRAIREAEPDEYVEWLDLLISAASDQQLNSEEDR